MSDGNARIKRTIAKERKKDTDPHPGELSLMERLFMRIFISSLIKKANKMQKSWKTSLAGWGAVLSALGGLLIAYSDGNLTMEDIKTLCAALGGVGLFSGIGLFNARDNNKSSEQVGAK